MSLPRTNQSLISTITRVDNFVPQLSAKLTVAAASASITFTPVTGTLRQTFKITNKGSNGAYIGWGKTTATAVVTTGTPTAHCDYIGVGAILIQDFEISSGTVDTIAAIQDGGGTTLEITVGYGQ